MSKLMSSNWSWRVDEAELKEQVKNYKTLKITESYRGVSVLIISALLALSLIISFFGFYSDTETVIWGILIYIPILFFVYKGHRWAIILLIALWTLEKGYQVYEAAESGRGAIAPIIWWFLIVPYFWKALRVENERNKTNADVAIGGFCGNCGNAIKTDSKYCNSCGKALASST